MNRTASNPVVVTTPTITDHDRLSLTFFLAAVFHGIIILGITFSVAPLTDEPSPPALDIILVQTHNPSEPDEAKYLAQVSQQGGGDSEEKSRPRDLFTAPTLAEDPGLALETAQPESSSVQQNEQTRLLHQQDSDYSVNTDKQMQKPDETTQQQQNNSNNNAQIARLAQEISTIIEKQAERPKVKFLNSSTKEFLPAQYMREWINRVERIGNLNYPDSARRQQLSGTLILDVVINSEGQLVKTDLRQSSGHKTLDDAAQRIVKLAAPYSPFPAKLKQEADVIHITRSWEFLSHSQLRTH